MSKKSKIRCGGLIYLISVVLVLGSVSNAATIHWTDNGADHLWSTRANWESNKVPTAVDEVYIDVPPAAAPNGPIIQDGIDAKALGLACEVAGEPTMTMTGGTLEIMDWIWWGDGAGSHGTFNMSGGTITVASELELGWGDGEGTWNMTGGTITCGELIIPTGSGAAGQLYLHGGTVNVGSIGFEMNANGLIDVGGGTLVLEGDLTETINDFIAAGQITFYGGGGLSSLDYDVRNPGKTTLTARWTGKAYNPSPADGALHEDTWVNLGWSPADNAISHDVYFGENFDDVDAAAEGAFYGNQTSTFFVAGFPGFAYPDGLIPGTTYYWRVNEIEDDGTIRKGDIWSFTVPPKTAYFPDPADGDEFIDPNADLSWTAGFGAKLHTVYFGDNFDDVNNAAGGLPQGAATYTLGPLKLAKTYYWRVDEFDVIDTHKGDVWSFTTQGAVSTPKPSNGAVDVKQTQILTWSPGDQAASHQLYFGTDKEVARNANTGSPEYKGTRNLGSETYDPGKLQWDTTYYWRIDEVNNINPDSPWAGPIWSFTTADFLIVDDFESYNDLDPADPESNRIFNVWLDGLDNPTNGSVVGYDNPPFAEQIIVHSGSQSMPLFYDNSLGYSEATYVLTYPRDWTENGVNTLTIWFRGDSANSAEALYVALNGSAVVNHDNPDAAQIDEWTEWNIDLQAFADQGVNLANVNTIALGLGSRNNPQAGGSGTMYFDDIRLYRPAPPEVPEGLVALWNFDEGSGTTAADSSGNGHDGTISGATWTSPGAEGTGFCLDFDGQGTNRVSVGTFSVAGNAISIACWYKADNLDTPGNDPRLISKAIGGASEEHWFMVSSSRVSDTKVLRFRLKTDGTTGELKADTATGNIELDVWTHTAAVWDGATMRLYKNGVEVGSTAKGGTLSTDPAAKVSIGNQPAETGDRPWDGLIDDVRIYDRALSVDEIAELAGL